MRRAAPRAEFDEIPLPEGLQNLEKEVELCGDIMFVNGLPFLTSVARRLQLRTVQHMAKRRKGFLISGIKAITSYYDSHNFHVSRMFFDCEFEPLKADSQALGGLEIFTTGQNDHVPEAERNNRTIKERVRSLLAKLPFNKYPACMIIEAVSFSVLWLNAFPSKNGISATVSPRHIVDGTVLDYNTHCKIPFGSYVQTSEQPEPTNTMVVRTSGAICLGPTGNP